MTSKEVLLYDEIVELGIATTEEINLVRCCMDGFWSDVLEAILYARTGYHTLKQMMEEEE